MAPNRIGDDVESQRSRPRWIASVMLMLLYAGTFVVLVIPAVFLATGIQAIGRARGWWVGDSNDNDGEEVFATVIGALGTLGVLAIAALIGFLLLRGTGWSLRRTLGGLATGTAAVIVGHTLLALYLFKQA